MAPFGPLLSWKYPYVFVFTPTLSLLANLTLGQAIYPTIIIIFVSKFMSQDAAVYSYPMAYRSEGSPLGNTQLGRAQGANGSSTVSAISAISAISAKQFDRPQIATQTFSIVCEGRDDESSKGLKQGMLTVV